MSALSKLLRAASDPLSEPETARDALPMGPLADQVWQMLGIRNGYFAFESALLVRPASPGVSGVASVAEWNEAAWWKAGYGGIVDSVTFFAEDIFGCQFGIQQESVVSFNPESGELKQFAGSLEEWASNLIADYFVTTGYPIAHDWQIDNGALRPGYRLVPRIPFVLGGEFACSNMMLASERSAMQFYSELARRISETPDGSAVNLDLKELRRILVA